MGGNVDGSLVRVRECDSLHIFECGTVWSDPLHILTCGPAQLKVWYGVAGPNPTSWRHPLHSNIRLLLVLFYCTIASGRLSGHYGPL